MGATNDSEGQGGSRPMLKIGLLRGKFWPEKALASSAEGKVAFVRELETSPILKHYLHGSLRGGQKPSWG